MKKAISNGQVNFTFDGGLAAVTFDPAKASEANRNYAVAFGFSHRIGDHAAISRNGPNGSIITVTEDMRRNAVLEMVAHLESGTENWDMAKSARGPVQHPVFLEIAKRNGISYDEAVAKVLADNMRDLAAAKASYDGLGELTESVVAGIFPDLDGELKRITIMICPRWKKNSRHNTTRLNAT